MNSHYVNEKNISHLFCSFLGSRNEQLWNAKPAKPDA